MAGVKSRASEAPQLSRSEQRRLSGKHVALVRGRVAAWGRSSVEAFERARRKFPRVPGEEIELMFVPRPGVLILAA